MLLCPSCGESLKKEARQCRHCQQDVSVSARLTRSLSEREAYEFFKIWTPLEYDNTQQKRWGDYRQAKQALTENQDLLLVQGLSQAQWEDLNKRLSDFPLEKQSSEIKAKAPEGLPIQRKSSASSWVFASLSLLAFGVAWALWPTEENLSDQDRAGSLEVQIQVPDLESSARAASQNSEANDRRDLPPPPLQTNRERMEQALNSTVFIRESNSLGSGFLISPNGHILTNHHVVNKMSSPQVILRDGRELTARKISQDPDRDLALIKVDLQNHPYLRMGDASELYAGESVITIGNPSGLSFTVTQGVVSFVGRPINGVHYIQTDSAINPGNSGGPMINSNFEVVGINTLTARVEKGISFSVPINYAYHGITEGIGSYPRDALKFPETPSVGQVSLSPDQNLNVPQRSDHYQQEADRLAQERLSQKHDHEEKAQNLVQEAENLQQEIPRTKLIRERNQKVERLKEIDNELQSLNSQDIREQIQYLRRIISILRRQQGDPAYSTHRQEIQSAIQSAEAQRKNLESQL